MDEPVDLAAVDRLTERLELARTFFIPFEEYERVGESEAISQLLSVASHPNLDEVYEAAQKLDKFFEECRFDLVSGWPAYQLLVNLLGFLFSSDTASEDVGRPQPHAPDESEGRLRLHRHEGSLIITGWVPTFQEYWDLWSRNPRRDLSLYVHEIVPDEELAAKRRNDGARRPWFHERCKDADKLECLTKALHLAVDRYIPGEKNEESTAALVQVARETDTEAIGTAGTRLLSACESKADFK